MTGEIAQWEKNILFVPCQRSRTFNILFSAEFPSTNYQLKRRTRTRTGPESLEGRDWNGESHAEGTCAWISLNTKLCLVFRALSEGDEWNSKARVCGMNKKWNCVCQNIPVSMSVSAFRRALRSGADNRNNQCFLPQRTTQGERKSSILANDVFFFPSYHSHHLQVLQIRPFCGQQLLGDKVGPVRWEPLT